MVLEHQTQMHNAIAAANYETRSAIHQSNQMNELLGRPEGFVSDSAKRRIASSADRVLRYLLFCDEFPLTDSVRGTTSFDEDFADRGKIDSRGRSLREFDLEKHFLRAMLDLRKCNPESLRRAEVSILKARMEGKRLERIKREALEATLEIGSLLKGAKGNDKAWSSKNEYVKLEDSVDQILKALDQGKYELAHYLSRNALQKAGELKELKLTAFRYAAKAGHVVAKVKAEEQTTLPKGSFTRLNTFLSTIKYLLEEGDYQTAMVLAKGVKHEAEILLPPERTATVTFVCPICYDTKCPNEHCRMSISPSPLVHETCRTYCSCGTYYHICCVQKGTNLECVNCRKPLKG
jgi:hypothetical protein